MKSNIIKRYIMRIIFPNFLLGVIIFSIINLIQYLYEFISLSIEKNVPVTKVFKLLVYIIPFLMTFTIPVGVLIGVLLAMGELSANNELVAMRTNGLTIPDIFRPCLLFALIVAVCHILFFQWVLPWGNKNYVMAKYEMLRKNPTLEISTKKEFSEGEIEIRVERSEVKEQKFYGVRVVNFKENLIFIASEAQFLPKRKDLNAFPFLMKNVTAMPYVFRDPETKVSQHFYKSLKLYIKDIDIKKVIPKGSQLEGILALYERIQKMKLTNVVAEIKNYHNLVEKQAELNQVQNEIKTIRDPQKLQEKINRSKILSLNIKNQKEHLSNLRDNIAPKNETYLLHRKFSYAASAILLAFLAVPLGMVNRRRGKEVAFGIGVLVVVGYNSLLIGGNFSWKLGYVSPVFGAWLPNVVIAMVIVVITYLKMRD
jgi:lipopolysaccharide export system permease protein